LSSLHSDAVDLPRDILIPAKAHYVLRATLFFEVAVSAESTASSLLERPENDEMERLQKGPVMW
jgi:hypothetical protein